MYNDNSFYEWQYETTKSKRFEFSEERIVTLKDLTKRDSIPVYGMWSIDDGILIIN